MAAGALKVGAMFGRCVWLAVTVLSVATAVAVAKGSAKRELQQLVRLPMLEFGTPLEFHRRFGFVVFPDESMAALEAVRVLKEVKGRTEDAGLHLKAARIFDAQGDVNGAMRQYSRAIDLYRKWLDVSPEEQAALAGLGEALTALGRFSEAQAVLEQTGNSKGKVELSLAKARLYRERAWFAAAGEAQRYATSSFMDQLVGLVRNGPNPGRVEDSKRFLKLAEEALQHAFEADADEALEVERLRERAGFRSVASAVETALMQSQNGELKTRALRASIFTGQVLHDLVAAAELSDDPGVIAASAFAAWEGAKLPVNWASSGESDVAEVYVRRVATRLQEMVENGGEEASAAAEFLGCVRLQLLSDAPGAERIFRHALKLEAGRYRSWELLTLASAQQGTEEFVEVAEERAAALPHPRSSVLLVKSYARHGNTLRAEWTALNAAGTYPNDWLVNLTLAAMLLKDENAESFLWRVEEALRKAEKGLGTNAVNAKRSQRLDFVLVKSVFLGMSNREAEARRLVEGARPLTPELQEVLRVLGN